MNIRTANLCGPSLFVQIVCHKISDDWQTLVWKHLASMCHQALPRSIPRPNIHRKRSVTAGIWSPRMPSAEMADFAWYFEDRAFGRGNKGLVLWGITEQLDVLFARQGAGRSASWALFSQTVVDGVDRWMAKGDIGLMSPCRPLPSWILSKG